MAFNQIRRQSGINRQVYTSKERKHLIPAASRKNVCFTAAVTTVERDLESFLIVSSAKPRFDVRKFEGATSDRPFGNAQTHKHDSMWAHAEKRIEKLRSLTNELERSLQVLQQSIDLTAQEGKKQYGVMEKESMTGPVLVMGATLTSGLLKLTGKNKGKTIKKSSNIDRGVMSDAIITSIKERSSMSKDGGKRRQLLRKEEEEGLLQAFQAYLHFHDSKVHLAKKIRREPTELEVARYTKTDVSLLRDTVQLGKEAEIALIRHNIGLVRSISWKFLGKGVPMEDLLDEGVQGLIHAMKKFKPSRGFRLSTYATWWIKQKVVEAVRKQGDVVSLPLQMYHDVMKLRKTWGEISKQSGKEPSTKALALALGWTETRAEKTRAYGLLMSGSILSLEALGLSSESEEQHFEISSDAVDDGWEGLVAPSVDAEQFASQTVLDEQVTSILKKKMRGVEHRVLELRMALNGGEPQTLKEISKEVNLTAEGVRCMQWSALKKLRRSHDLKELLDEGLSDEPEIPARGAPGYTRKPF
ncbi:hypothetical protein CEUSTIGMA_g2924.t1 [Chlamydomonas eustigma]|uniref:RNA polymerase sigma-70 region 2 domain-containing protein n=1 Tax=Chlamydomonas eustigma TaxID=1157962 RepID=A0A250WXD9_9CHLO|nr:hypothetical protein CEUSTIGMA_g2924.t1 [Chlamydomonas eustigma]|eukprot:GAX75481.1 hypothetical protein CEUSTIGMA_g2924.t1 [Chlamydomonas eustigma]